MLCILRWYHWHSSSSRCFAYLPARSGSLTKRIIIAIWICEYWMCLCPYVILLYGWHTHTRRHRHKQISSTQMRHSEWADGAERVSSSKRGTVLFYFISFHFIFFFFFWAGSTDWSGGLFCRVPQQKQHGNTNRHTKPHTPQNGVLWALWNSGQWDKSSRKNQATWYYIELQKGAT